MVAQENIIVFTDTKDRINLSVNSGTSDYQLNIDSIADRKGKASFHLLSAVIPNVIYPISAARLNNTIYFYEDGSTATTFSAAIADGGYTTTTLAAALKTAMDASAGANTYTITYDSSTLKITIATSGTSVKIITGALSMENELGVNVSQTFAASYVCAYQVNLAGTSYIDMDIRNYTNLNVGSGNTLSPLYRIPMGVPFGAKLFHQATQNEMIRVHISELRNLTINLYDDKGLIISIPNNHHIGLALKIQFDYN